MQEMTAVSKTIQASILLAHHAFSFRLMSVSAAYSGGLKLRGTLSALMEGTAGKVACVRFRPNWEFNSEWLDRQRRL